MAKTVMKEGEEKYIGGKKAVWVICPDCDEGRWVLEGNTKRISFTGRCMKCSREHARQDMQKYFIPW